MRGMTVIDEDRPLRIGRWLIALAALVVFGLFGGVLWYAYRDALAGDDEPRLVRADPAPFKTPPLDRGGERLANVGRPIVSVFKPVPEPPREEPLPAEEPLAPVEDDPAAGRLQGSDTAPDAAEIEPPPSALEPGAALQPEPEPEPEVAAPLPESPPEPAPEALAALEPALPEPTAPATPPAAVGVPTPGAPVPLARPSVPVPAEEPPAVAEEAPVGPAPVEPPAPEPPAPEPPAEDPLVIAGIEPAREPPPTRRTAPVAPPAPVEPVQPRRPVAEPLPQRQAVLVPPPAATVAPPRISGTVWRLQLAALSSESALPQAWNRLQSRYPDTLANVSANVERAQTSTGTLYRLQAGPFGDRTAALAACGEIRAQGGQCFIVATSQ